MNVTSHLNVTDNPVNKIAGRFVASLHVWIARDTRDTRDISMFTGDCVSRKKAMSRLRVAAEALS